MTSRLPRHLAFVLALLVTGGAVGDDLEEELASLDPTVLDRILADMRLGIGSERDADPTRIAGHRLRSIVCELVAQGRRSTPAAPLAALAAIRLDAAMPALEARLNELADGDPRSGTPSKTLDPETRSRLLARLEVFNAVALDELRRRSTGSVSDLDEAMSLVLAPIRDVMETTTGHQLRNRWPTEMPGETRLARNESVTDAHDAELVRLARRLEILDRSDSVDLDALEAILQNLSVERPPAAASDSRNLLERCIAVLEAKEALTSCEVPPGLHAAQRRCIGRLKGAIDRAIIAMTQSPDAVSAEALDRSATELDRITHDIDAIGVTCDVLEKLRRIAPKERSTSIVLLRTWLRDLERDSTRSASLERFRLLRDSLGRCFDLPGESWLTDTQESPHELFAGRQSDLADRLELMRTRWASEVATGTLDGPAAREIDRIGRLLRIVLECEPVLGAITSDEQSVQADNRWAGWYLDPQSVVWMSRSLRPGIVLASNAAADGRTETLSSDLDRIEKIAPIVRLKTRLRARLEPSLAGTRSGDLGTVAVLSMPPSEDAWGVDLRRDLAIVSRGLAEITAARRIGDVTLADRLADQVSRRIVELLDELHEIHPLPAVQMEIGR